MLLPSTPNLSLLRWQVLGPSDLPALHALHQLSIDGLPVAVVKPETRAFLASLLQGRGWVLGAWAQDSLVAYGVLQHDVLAHDTPHALLHLSAAQRLYKLAGAAVHPAWRGLGLQHTLIARRMQQAGNAAVFSTAAPANRASWLNLLACGLQVRALQYRYGGHARYLLAHIPGDTALADPERWEEWGLDALAPQAQLLQQGFRGVSPGKAPSSLRLQLYYQEQK